MYRTTDFAQMRLSIFNTAKTIVKGACSTLNTEELPENLGNFPLLMLGIMKNELFLSRAICNFTITHYLQFPKNAISTLIISTA